MNMSRALHAAPVLCAALLCLGAVQSSPSQRGPQPASRPNENAVLQRLVPAAGASVRSFRIYYRADCHAEGGDPVTFPRIAVQAPSKGKTGLVAVKEMFPKGSYVRVTEEQPGIIKIWIGNVPDAILQTKIANLPMSPIQRYNPIEAIFAIEGADAVQSAMRELGFRLPPTGSDQIVVKPATRLPHLGRRVRDMTLDQVLDLVARTFGGAVLYGACKQEDGGILFSIDYSGVDGPVPR